MIRWVWNSLSLKEEICGRSGYLSPALAAVGMAASSALVVANALRARR